jgi:hypothetical protein
MPPARSKAKPGKSSLTDEILAAPGLVRNPTRSWHDTLPPDLLGELEAIKKAFHAGEVQATKIGMARSIAAAVTKRGYPIKFEAVRRWLLD